MLSTDSHSVNRYNWSMSLPKQQKRVSKSPEVRREELLRVASTLFLKRGVSATTIGNITDRAEVARGTFYLYFRSKDDLVAELWKRYVDGYLKLADATLKRLGADEPDGAQILELMVHMTEHALDHAHLHRQIYGTADAPALALCRRSDEMILARLTDALRGYFNLLGAPIEKADLTASLLFHGLDGALHSAIMKEEPIDRATFIDGVREFSTQALAIDAPPRSR